MAVSGFAREARFVSDGEECVDSTLLSFDVDGFGGAVGVVGDVLEGVTSLAPSDDMDMQYLWYQHPGPTWSESDPTNFLYGGQWRVTQVDESLVISVNPERICRDDRSRAAALRGRPYNSRCAAWGSPLSRVTTLAKPDGGTGVREDYPCVTAIS